MNKRITIKWAVLTALCVACGACLIGGCGNEPSPSAHAGADETEAPADDVIVFFGDSITDMGDWQAWFPGLEVYNHGVSGDKTADLTERIDAVKSSAPTKLFIMVGINDLLSGRTIGETLADWNALLDECEKLDCRIYVQSVLPVSERLCPDAGYIPDFNAALERLAAEHGAEYLDVYSLYADENGYLKRECTGDGLHLLPSAYEIWVEAIREKAEG